MSRTAQLIDETVERTRPALREWIKSRAPTLVVEAVVTEAEDVLRADLEAGHDASYEIPARITASGESETYWLPAVQ